MRLARIIRRLGVWWAVLGWAGLIFYFSEQPSVGDSASSLPPLGLLPGWTQEWLYHGTAFAALTVLIYSAARLTLSWPWPLAAILALALSVGYGGVDELHQSFVPGRYADAGDIGRDAIGAFFAILIARVATVALARLVPERILALGRMTQRP